MGNDNLECSLSNTPSDFKLILLGTEDGIALLKLMMPDGSEMTVRLKGRHIKVLLVLNDALQQDQHAITDEVARGWMTDELIAQAYTRNDPRVIPPTPKAIARYRAQINSLVRRATPEGFHPPKLLLTERCVGVRLTQPLIVVKLNAHRKFDSLYLSEH